MPVIATPVVPHDLYDSHSPEDPRPRAKRLARTDRTYSVALATRLAERATDGQVAQDWGTDRSLPRKVREGRAPFTIERLMALRKPYREHLLLCLLALSDAPEVIDVHGEPTP